MLRNATGVGMSTAPPQADTLAVDAVRWALNGRRRAMETLHTTDDLRGG
jgi:hypothetical protein